MPTNGGIIKGWGWMESVWALLPCSTISFLCFQTLSRSFIQFECVDLLMFMAIEDQLGLRFHSSFTTPQWANFKASSNVLIQTHIWLLMVTACGFVEVDGGWGTLVILRQEGEKQMSFPGEAILTDLIRRLVDKTIKEVSYFRHFETHDCEFKRVQELWERKLEKVQEDIKDAKRYNQYQNDREIQNWIVDAENWIVEAENLIQKKAEIRLMRFDTWCLRQFRQGKRLAQRTLTIQEHMKKCNFGTIACPAELLVLKYHASRNFIDFESRKTEFEQLVKALKDGNMVGLQGMGGMGKTTLAIQVGKHFEESKTFEKVIFVVVSNSPDVKKIQGDIANQLDLPLKEIGEEDRSVRLWSSIHENAKNLLIILDDVWEELNLERIGIPFGPDQKNCYVLITTRRSNVCQAMTCQQTVRLRILNDEDALRLFQFHAKSDDRSSRNEWEDLARGFLKECGGLPVAIVALASTLKNRHVGEWIEALRALKNSMLLVDVDEDLEKVYSCLRLSYDYLHNKKAQELFLLCSIFPEDYEFPINLVIRLGIGSGIFEEADDYYGARRQALLVTKKLIDSSLLHKVGEKECVKMHDLVREVAQLIAKKDIQVIKDSSITLKTNTRFVFWSGDDFPDLFDETNLEILLLWISGNVLVKDPNVFFARMSRLKILFLLGEYDRKVPSASLSNSLLSLKYIQTLILDGWELGDISILKNIQSLVTLEFKNCLIIELPRNILELKKLRWLGMRNCEIQKNNSFEVIERCSQLEEVYFVQNFEVEDWNTEDDKEIEDETAQDIFPPKLQVFSIAYNGFRRFPGDDNGLRRCFSSKQIKHLISDAMFKTLVRSAEVLELGEMRQNVRLWDVPSFISIFQNCVLRQPQVSKEDLKEKHANSKASAFSWAHGCCFLALTKHTNIRVPNDMMEHHTISQEIKKHMQDVTSERAKESELQEIVNKCPSIQNVEAPKGSCGSSKMMETVHTAECLMRYPLSLQNIRKMTLLRCSKLKSLFSVSIATTMIMLEKLKIVGCEELKDIITNATEDDDHLNCTSIFPKLRSIYVKDCNKLEFIFPSTLSGGLKLNVIAPEDLMKIIKDVQKLTRLRIRDSKIEELWSLKIEEASELEQVFIHKQDDMQKMTMMDEVFPELSNVTLRKLPMLVTICEGIDFQNVRCSVNDCPKYQGINDIQEELEDGDSENQARRNVSPDFLESSKETMTTSLEEVASSFSEKETVKEIEAKDPTPALLKKQALEGLTTKPQGSTTKPQLRSTSLHNYKETEKEGGRVVLDPVSKLLAPTSSSFQIMEETLIDIQAKDSNRASGKQASETSVAKSHLRGTSLPELEDEPETSESIMQLQQEDLVKTKTTKASHKTNIPFHDNSIDVILKERAEGSTSEDVVAATMVADLAPRNSWSVTSSVVSQVEGSKSGPSTLVTQGIKDTMEQGLKDNYPEDDAMISVRSTNSYSRKRSTVGPIDNLSRKDSAMSAKEKAKGVHEKATATCTLPMATPFESEFIVEEAGDHSNVQKEAELEKPIKVILPQVIPSLHYQSQYVDAGSSSLKLGICEIFRLVELKYGETALLAQALEQYPQLLLHRANRTDRIIALSYRVLVDILVMLDTKTPNTITQSEKSTLEANLSDAIFLGFDKDWVESIRAKVLGVDMSDILAAKEKIQVMEVNLREIDSQLVGLSEDRKKLIVNMMFRDIVSNKDKPFGI
ncbi:hypothetical protein K1719_046069 [Acacia pycnantha]|nr:hypothetical protein K1719_046069 [Acacia pycnantha]